MNKYITTNILVLCIITCCFHTKAECQDIKDTVVNTKISMINREATNEWKIYLNMDSIEISYKVIKCSILNNNNLSVFIVLRFDNNTNTDFTVEWYNKLFSKTRCFPKNSQDKEAFRKIDVKKRSSSEGDCSISPLRIFIKKMGTEDYFKIERFQLEELKISSKQAN